MTQTVSKALLLVSKIPIVVSYKFSSQKSCGRFWNEKLVPNFWLENLYNMMTRVQRRVYVIDNCLWILIVHNMGHSFSFIILYDIWFLNKNDHKCYSSFSRNRLEKSIRIILLQRFRNLNHVHFFNGRSFAFDILSALNAFHSSLFCFHRYRMFSFFPLRCKISAFFISLSISFSLSLRHSFYWAMSIPYYQDEVNRDSILHFFRILQSE